MYINLRRYPILGVDKSTIEQSVENELVPVLEAQQGFKGYCAFWDQNDAGISFSIFDDHEAAVRSTGVARQWVMRNQKFFPERGEEFSGECTIHEVMQGQEQVAGARKNALYVLVRYLENVPGTQDTQAFVQQRTLPMIMRSSGFRGVYMVRGDREERQAAVITLHDTKQHAVAAHEKALELLKEGLPGVKVTRVVHGPSVILAIGD